MRSRGRATHGWSWPRWCWRSVSAGSEKGAGNMRWLWPRCHNLFYDRHFPWFSFSIICIAHFHKLQICLRVLYNLYIKTSLSQNLTSDQENSQMMMCSVSTVCWLMPLCFCCTQNSEWDCGCRRSCVVSQSSWCSCSSWYSSSTGADKSNHSHSFNVALTVLSLSLSLSADDMSRRWHTSGINSANVSHFPGLVKWLKMHIQSSALKHFATRSFMKKYIWIKSTSAVCFVSLCVSFHNSKKETCDFFSVSAPNQKDSTEHKISHGDIFQEDVTTYWIYVQIWC